MSFKHLDKDTIPILEKSLKEKLAWARKKHFVLHEKAEKCLNKLNWVYEQTLYVDDDETLSDMIGLSIIGETGAGKTSIFKEFERMHSPEYNLTQDYYPVVDCMLKDSITGLKGLYSSLLSPFNHPYAKFQALKMGKITIDQLEEALIHTLKQTRTKLYFIDEFQHAFGRNQKAILNQLKRTMLVSQVPFVLVGMPEIETILQLDKQLADRCPVRSYSRLDFLKYGIEFRKFIAGYERKLPFPEPSDLSSKQRARLIFDRISIASTKNGLVNMRGIAEILKLSSFEALRNKHNCIHEEDIENAQI